MRLAVTHHLHFWQNDWDLLHGIATAVIKDTEIKVSIKSPGDLSIMSPVF